MLWRCWSAFRKKCWMCMSVVVTGERSGLLSKVYDDPRYNAAFDRCIDVMAKLILKYGNQVLERQEKNASLSLSDQPNEKKDGILDNAA